MGVTTDIVVHIYADNDKNDYEIKSMINKPLFRVWIDKLFIHRNTFENEKDYGVIKERIIDTSYPIKIKRDV